ncbi:MAG: DUF6092 family protein [Candidatus Caldarchaeales archaeon]
MERDLETIRDRIFELACFLISSAKGCFREPKSYGPLRLLQAFLLLNEISKSIEGATDEFIERTAEKISKNLILVSDEKKFEEFVSQLGVEVASEIKKRIR